MLTLAPPSPVAAPSPCRHYLHTLEGSQINTIRPDAATGAVSVSATFREAVEAHRGSGEPVQAFRCVLLYAALCRGQLTGSWICGQLKVWQAGVWQLLAVAACPPLC
jgi:hypothetical protein